MCFNDWRVGRLIRSVFRPSVNGNGSSIVMAPNKQRVGLTISIVDLVGALNVVATVVESVSGFMVLFLDDATPVTHITLATHGDLPTKGLTVSILGGTIPELSIIEYIAPEEYLAAGLEEFESEYAKRNQ